MKSVDEEILELHDMKKYPPKIFYEGDLKLLQRKKISIIGSRKPSKYSRTLTQNLARALAKQNICVVSGGAMGIDATAHMGAGSSHTIAVLPCGIDIRYPAVNKNMFEQIEQNGLLLSQFESGFRATPWSFVVRNELVVALGEVLVVAEAELGSGSMRSIEIALKMGKKIFVFPHRLGESSATQKLLMEGNGEAIYDIDSFVSSLGNNIEHSENICKHSEDEFILFCKDSPNYEETLKKYPNRLFEAELNGKIIVKNGKVLLQ